jgi:acetylornithine deacetylase/succinyl-diaminopimelate desuccinylase-like protein
VGEAGVGAPYVVEERPDLRVDFLVGEGAGERYETQTGPIYLLDRGVKCTATATLVARGRPLDASLPVGDGNAAYELARLLSRLAEHRSPLRILPEVEPLLDRLAPTATDAATRVSEARSANAALDPVIGALVGTVVQATVAEVKGPANVVPETAKAELQCVTLPGTSRGDLEQELRGALGDGNYTLEVTEPTGGLISPLETPLHRAIEGFLLQHDPEATLVPTLGYGFSDCHVFREAYGTVAYGFIPFRHASPSLNLATKHSIDERVLVADLEFQVQAALHTAVAMGATGGD